MKGIQFIAFGILLLALVTGGAMAQESMISTSVSGGASLKLGSDTGDSASSDDEATLKLKAEIARAEAEKAKAEAEKARADAARAKAELEMKKAAAANVDTNSRIAPPPPAPAPVQTVTDTTAQPNHRGLYLRLTPGLGLGTVWGKGMMDAHPGLVAIDNPRHTTLTGTIGFDIGAGIIENLALHVGAFYEKMILRKTDPTTMVFSILGLDAGLTWYFTDLELYLTGQFRWVAMLLKFPEVNCSEFFKDSFEWYKGPGLSLTFGREWYNGPHDESAAGIGIQANYYRMHGGHDKTNDLNQYSEQEKAYIFNQFSLLLVLTFTHF